MQWVGYTTDDAGCSKVRSTEIQTKATHWEKKTKPACGEIILQCSVHIATHSVSCSKAHSVSETDNHEPSDALLCCLLIVLNDDEWQ